jgi:hypothetical protein
MTNCHNCGEAVQGGSMRPVKCVKVACSSTPHHSLARHQLRLFGHLFLPSIQLRQGPGAEVTF